MSFFLKPYYQKKAKLRYVRLFTLFDEVRKPDFLFRSKSSLSAVRKEPDSKGETASVTGTEGAAPSGTIEILETTTVAETRSPVTLTTPPVAVTTSVLASKATTTVTSLSEQELINNVQQGNTQLICLLTILDKSQNQLPIDSGLDGSELDQYEEKHAVFVVQQNELVTGVFEKKLKFLEVSRICLKKHQQKRRLCEKYRLIS